MKFGTVSSDIHVTYGVYFFIVLANLLVTVGLAWTKDEKQCLTLGSVVGSWKLIGCMCHMKTIHEKCEHNISY